MKKIGEMYCGRSGNYLICNQDNFFRSPKYAALKIDNNYDSIELLDCFYFKKDASDYIQHEEHKYLRSESYLQSQVDSGLLSEEEMLEITKGENNV